MTNPPSSSVSSDLAPAQPTPVPIVLVGRNRSGTTWLSNILCNHSDIAGIQHEHHWGIIETNLFHQMEIAIGDISHPENYVAFVELWSQTDFFKASRVAKEIFYTTSPRPTTYLGAFEILMNEVARRRKKRFWMQKTNLFDAPAVIRHFADCRVVAIKRELMEVLESYAKSVSNRGCRVSPMKTACGYVTEEKLLNEIRRKRDVVYVEYEKLRDDTEAEVTRICTALSIPFEPNMLQVHYRRNTSFRSDQVRILSSSGRVLARLAALVARAIPLRLLLMGQAALRSRRVLFGSGTFSEIRRRYDVK